MDTNSVVILTLLGSSPLMVSPCFPIAYAVAPSSVFCLLLQGRDLTTICQQMVRGISSFSLMAVPPFITIGCLMGFGGISEKLIALVSACVGWMRGGMAMVNIVTSYFFGGVSGSASADTAPFGSVLIPMVTDQGYDDDFPTTVTVISSRERFPMLFSHNMVTYVTIVGGISVGSLSLAGYIPGVLLVVTLMIGFYTVSARCNYPKGKKFSIISLVEQLNIFSWAPAAVLIVISGVVGDAFTVTKSAAVTVIHSLIVSMFIYKGLDWKRVWGVLGDSMDTLSIVMIPIATSSIFGFRLTQLHVSVPAASAITGMINNPILLALLLNLILLAFRCIMDMAPIVLIATPIPFPITASIGLDPIQFGIMVVLDCGIGLLTPPVGAVLFIGSVVSEVPMEWAVRTTLPFYVCTITTLLLITLIPAISM